MAMILGPSGHEVPLMPSTTEAYNEAIRKIDEASEVMAGGKGLLAATFALCKKNEAELHALKLHMSRKKLISPADSNRESLAALEEIADEMTKQADELKKLIEMHLAAKRLTAQQIAEQDRFQTIGNQPPNG